jgi:predicted DNA-binding ribbon-helix-helix protein
MPSHKPRRSPAWSRALDAVENNSGGLVSYNVRVAAKRTSMRLDALTWTALREIARLEATTLHQLCEVIDAARPRGLSLTAAVRSYVVGYFRISAARARGKRAVQ